MDSPNATSLPGSVDGLSLFEWRAGRTINPAGQEAALASHSATQESGLENQTLGTSGQFGSRSSASADLQRSLVSRLQARLPFAGLTVYSMTWRERITP